MASRKVVKLSETSPQGEGVEKEVELNGVLDKFAVSYEEAAPETLLEVFSSLGEHVASVEGNRDGLFYPRKRPQTFLQTDLTSEGQPEKFVEDDHLLFKLSRAGFAASVKVVVVLE